MRAHGFTLGLVVGGALGAGAMWWVQSGPARTASDVGALSGHSDRATERAVTPALVGVVPPTVADAPAATDASMAVPTSTSASPEPAASTVPAEEYEAQKRKMAVWTELKAQMKALEGEAPGSEKLVAAIAGWRTMAAGDDPVAAEVAGKALVSLARRALLTPDDVEALRAAYDELPAGASGRPALAATVARAWARDERLAGWIAALPRTDEPAVREWVTWSLDETPSAAYRDWILRMSADERNAAVLDTVWNEDIVVVNLTRENASAFATTIETRIGWGDLPAVTRARGYMALGLIAQHAPLDARRSLADLLTREGQAGALAFGRAVLSAIDRSESNLQALEGLWDEHEGTFKP